MALVLLTNDTDYSARNLGTEERIIYGEISYIQSDGNVYIDTGFSGYRDNSNDVAGNIPEDAPRIEITIETGPDAQNKCIFSTENSGSFMLSKVDVNRIHVGQRGATFSSVYDGTKKKIIFGSIKSYINDSLVKDNSDMSNQYRINTYDEHILLFYKSDVPPGYLTTELVNTNIKIYNFKAYSGDKLVKDLVPYRKTDGTVCMLDKVTGNYHYGIGSGVFIGK
ncbi:MAG: hypothetical protein SOT45_00425 [Treponema sp.]|nr:hypothetical protein [Treponema sp.]